MKRNEQNERAKEKQKRNQQVRVAALILIRKKNAIDKHIDVLYMFEIECKKKYGLSV